MKSLEYERARKRRNQKRWQLANPEKYKESLRRAAKRWAANHPNYQGDWQKKNPEKCYEYYRKWYVKNAQRIRERSRIRMQNKRVVDPNFREQEAAAVREYRKLHPEQGRAHTHKRRAQKQRSGGIYTAAQWLSLKAAYDNKCLCCSLFEMQLKCLKRTLSPDHVVSLSHGGSNDISNIQPLCHGKGGCNNHKGSKFIDFRRDVRQALGII